MMTPVAQQSTGLPYRCLPTTSGAARERRKVHKNPPHPISDQSAAKKVFVQFENSHPGTRESRRGPLLGRSPTWPDGSH